MSNIKIWGWDKKKRTMLRFIKSGDIFCFELKNQQYCFGRIIAKTVVGHIAEIFDYISSDTFINAEIIEKSSRLMLLIVLDDQQFSNPHFFYCQIKCMNQELLMALILKIFL